MIFNSLSFRRLLLAVFALSALSLAPAKAATEALLLIEAESGRVLHAENAAHPWYPASVTKLMTAYVTLHAVKSGRLSLESLVPVSENAASQAPSKMGFRPGTELTVDNALKMLMVKSANDVAVVLAEGVSGSIDNFADDMNHAARALGMTQTNYVNPNGLPDDRQVTSARDLAILARALLREFPEHELYWRLPAIKIGKRVMRNYNTLIDRYPGADGMKTGFICASGFNLVATATRNGKQLIAVVLGAPSGPVRAVKAASLLERGFTSNAPFWIAPSLGTVDKLSPVDAAPPNLREEMCGKHRKRPAAESEDIGDEQASTPGTDPGAAQGFRLSTLNANIAKPSTLLGPPQPSMPPVVVFTGARNTGQDDMLFAGAKPKEKSKAKAASKPATKNEAKNEAKNETKNAAKPAAKPSATAAKPASTKSDAAKPAAKPAAAKSAATPIAIAPTTSAPTAKPAAKSAADQPKTAQ